MTIRPAIRGDAPNAIPLILQAIGAIAFILTGTANVEEASSILTDFFGREQNRVSYENGLVLEEDGELVGLVMFYDGAGRRWRDAAPHSCWSSSARLLGKRPSTSYNRRPAASSDSASTPRHLQSSRSKNRTPRASGNRRLR